jgi:hypothetical protein
MKNPPEANIYPVIKYTVIVDVEKVIKGCLVNGQITFTWQDLAGAVSPHIDVPEMHVNGMKVYWYSTEPVHKKYLKASLNILVTDADEPEILKIFGVKS